MAGDGGVEVWERRGEYHESAGRRVLVVDGPPVDAASTADVPVLVGR